MLTCSVVQFLSGWYRVLSVLLVPKVGFSKGTMLAFKFLTLINVLGIDVSFCNLIKNKPNLQF